jgi:hypothetical protein
MNEQLRLQILYLAKDITNNENINPELFLQRMFQVYSMLEDIIIHGDTKDNTQ